MPGDPLTARTLFDGQRLTIARELRGLLKVDLAGLASKTPAAIGQYENGTTRPSVAMVGQLAMALQVPYDFFVGDRTVVRVAEDEVHFRSLRSVSKRQRLRELARVGLLAEFVRTLETKVRLPDVPMPKLRAPIVAEDLERAAEQLRSEWGLGTGPISHTVRLLEGQGAVVVKLSPSTAHVDAFSCWVENRPYVVLGQDKADPYRSRFDAAHELGHLLLHRQDQPGTKRVESQAHRFSSAFLMPRSAILRELPRRLDWPAWFALKRRWNVSVAALLYRAHDLGVMTDEGYRRAMVQMSINGWRLSEPSTGLQPEMPELLNRALSLIGGTTSASMAALVQDMRLGMDDIEAITGMKLEDRRPGVDVPPAIRSRRVSSS